MSSVLKLLKLLPLSIELKKTPVFGLLDKVELRDVKDRSLLSYLTKFNKKNWKLMLADICIAPMHDYFLSSLFLDLESHIGPVARTLVVRYAKNVGIDDANRIKKAIRKESLTIGEIRKILTNLLTLWCLLGWGKLERLEIEEGMLISERSSSFEAEGYLRLGRGYSKVPRCLVALGYVTGLVEGLTSKKAVGKETKCIAMGDDICRFEITW